MTDLGNLLEFIESVQNDLQPLKEGEFSLKINKVSMYLGTIGKNFNSFNSALESINQQPGGDRDKYLKEVTPRIALLKASVASSTKFARMNLDTVMAEALDKLIRRPKSANKTDEQKKIRSLQDWFDQLPDPVPAMLEHFKASSSPLDKWLVAGRWGHEYLRRRKIDLEDYDRQLSVLIPPSGSATIGILLSYGKLNRAIDEVEEISLKMLDMLEKEATTK